jgi:hypothetical protein
LTENRTRLQATEGGEGKRDNAADGGPQARRFLEDLGRDSPDGWLTQQAKASLPRLAAP